MTDYLKDTFTVANTSKAYRDNWARIFEQCCSEPELRKDATDGALECVSCGADYEEPHPNCNVCDEPFSEEEWEDRHDDAEDKRQSVHSRCCEECNGGVR